MKKIFIGILIFVSILSGCSSNNTDTNFDTNTLMNAGIHYELNDIENNEGEISANEAIVLISVNITPEADYDVMSQKLIYRAEKRDIVEDNECYIILFGPEENGEFKESKRYAVDVYGNVIFEMKENNWEKYE